MDRLDVELLAKHVFGYFTCVERAQMSVICKKWHTAIYDIPLIPPPKKCTTCAKAAENGHIQCLRRAKESGCPWDRRTTDLATLHGHLECLQYAHENGCPWDKRTTSYAAQEGRLECLRYAHENGCPWNKWIPTFAAENGHLECLQYAKENGCPST